MHYAKKRNMNEHFMLPNSRNIQQTRCIYDHDLVSKLQRKKTTMTEETSWIEEVQSVKPDTRDLF